MARIYVIELGDEANDRYPGTRSMGNVDELRVRSGAAITEFGGSRRRFA